MIRWWLPPEQRQEKKKRRPYIRGAKAFLASFEIGEERIINGEFRWSSILAIASRLKQEYGCEFRCRNKNSITRIA